MKKIILFITLIFTFTLSVLGADNIIERVTLKDIKLSNYELAPYEGTLEIDYELVPNDVEEKTINWSISDLKNGVTVNLKSGNKTENSVGTLVLEVKNSNNTNSTFRVTAKSGNVSKTVTVKIETQKETETRYKEEVVKEIETLINDIKKIDDDNIDSVEKAINKIEVMLKNEEVKNSVKENLLDEFEIIKENLNKFKTEQKKDYTKIGVISVLILAFFFGLYMIFKETKPKKEVKKTKTTIKNKTKK